MPERGCGHRQNGGLYLMVELAPYGEGKPIEDFLICEPIVWTGGNLRAPLEITNDEGIVDVIMGIGKQYYPYPSDFIEETATMGISKRLPHSFDMRKLTPGKSRLFLVHPRAIPDFPYTAHAEIGCPKNIQTPHNCVIDLWALSGQGVNSSKHEIIDGGDRTEIRTPSVNYFVPSAEITGEQRYVSGIIASFFITGFDYVTEDNTIPDDIKERQGRWNVRAVRE